MKYIFLPFLLGAVIVGAALLLAQAQSLPSGLTALSDSQKKSVVGAEGWCEKCSTSLTSCPVTTCVCQTWALSGGGVVLYTCDSVGLDGCSQLGSYKACGYSWGGYCWVFGPVNCGVQASYICNTNLNGSCNGWCTLRTSTSSCGSDCR